MTRVAAPTAKKPYSATAQADGALGALLNEAFSRTTRQKPPGGS